MAVKRKYALTVDTREAHALEVRDVSRCAGTAMAVVDGREAAPAPSSKVPGTSEANVQCTAALGME